MGGIFTFSLFTLHSYIFQVIFGKYLCFSSGYKIFQMKSRVSVIFIRIIKLRHPKKKERSLNFVRECRQTVFCHPLTREVSRLRRDGGRENALIKPFLTTPQSATQTAPLTRGAKVDFFDRLERSLNFVLFSIQRIVTLSMLSQFKLLPPYLPSRKIRCIFFSFRI